MRLTSFVLFALTASATPLHDVGPSKTFDNKEITFPRSAITGNFTIPDDIVPFVVEIQGRRVVLLINSTEAPDALESVKYSEAAKTILWNRNVPNYRYKLED